MNLSDYAAFFKAISDPTRLTVLQLLGSSAYGVLELSEMLDVKQSGMSHHLKVLSKAGWVDSRREGNSIYYRGLKFFCIHITGLKGELSV